jgi:hypothetical protein
MDDSMSNSPTPSTSDENPIRKALPKVGPPVIGFLLGWVGHQDHDILFSAGAATLLVAAVAVLVVGRYWKKDDPNSLLDINVPRVSVVPDWLRTTAKWLLLIVPVVVAVVCIFFWGVLFSLASVGQVEPASRPLVYATLPDDQTLELTNVVKFSLSKGSNAEKVRVKEVRLIVAPQPAKSVRMIVGSLPENVVLPNEFRAHLKPSVGVVVAEMYDGDKPAPAGAFIRLDKDKAEAVVCIAVSGDGGVYQVQAEVVVTDKRGWRTEVLKAGPPSLVYAGQPADAK